MFEDICVYRERLHRLQHRQGPFWEHDCADCELLGTSIYEESGKSLPVDLYVCRKGSDNEREWEYLARFGPGGDYWSSRGEIVRTSEMNPILRLARELA